MHITDFINIIIVSFSCCFLFFVWNSPIGETLKTPLEKQLKKIQVSNRNFLGWSAKQILHLINCVFCCSFWFVLFLALISENAYFLFLSITVPWVAVVMWVFWQALGAIYVSAKKLNLLLDKLQRDDKLEQLKHYLQK